MLVGHTEEQVQLRSSVRALLAEIASESEVRRLMATPTGTSAASWQQVVDMGLVGLAVPQALGGAGGSLVDQGVALEQMGRMVYGGPYLSTAVLGVQTLLEVGGDPAGDLLQRVCSGDVTATLALTEASGSWNETGVELVAERSGASWQLSGRKTFVPDGASADLLLVVGRTSAGTSLFAVQGHAKGLRRTPLATMDQTRKQAALEFASTPATLLGEKGEGWPAVSRALDASVVALAAEQVGGAQRVLDMTVEHAQTRRQFGRPVGSFQAVQHKCATLLVDVEAATSAAYYGLAAAAAGSPELPRLASLAKSFCSETYRRTTNEAIQIFGGIGLTWEHPLHLYFKRARSSEVLLGSPASHREKLATQLGIDEASSR